MDQRVNQSNTATYTRSVSIIGSNNCPKALFDYCLREGNLAQSPPFVPADEFYLDTRAIHFNHHDEHYLIHLINTPGHPEFIGEVSAALRITDGAIVVVDCTIGIAQHTINLVRRAVEEHVRVVLLFDKVESLLTLPPEEAASVLDLFLWKLNSRVPLVHNEFGLINDNVLFGSLEHGWVVSPEQLYRAFSASFPAPSNPAESKALLRGLYELFGHAGSKDLSVNRPSNVITDGNNEDNVERFHLALRKLCGNEALYEMIVKRLPSATEAQKYRAAYWYSGHCNDKVLTAITECDSNGPTMIYISKIVWGKINSSSELIPLAIGRIFSGSIRPNQSLYKIRSGQIDDPSAIVIDKLYKFTDTVEELEECLSGNVVLITGVAELVDKTATFSSLPTASAFNAQHTRYTVVVEYEVSSASPTDPAAVGLKLLVKCDIAVAVNWRDGYGSCICAVGPKHAEVLLKRHKAFAKVDPVINGPYYRYRESITAPSSVSCLSKSPNKLNRVWARARPMDSTLKQILSSQNVPFNDAQKNIEVLNDEYLFIEENNVSVVETNMIVIDETLMKRFSHQGAIDWLDSLRIGGLFTLKGGVLCEEPLIGAQFTLEDAVIAEDTRRRGGGQLIPMFRRSFLAAQLTAKPVLLEAILLTEIHVPFMNVNSVYNELLRKRAVVLIESEHLEHSNMTVIRCYVPVVESLELHEPAVSTSFFSHWEQVPGDPLEEGSFANTVTRSIRKIKALRESIPELDTYLDKL